MGVVLVGGLASGASGADSAASPASATALAVLGDGAGSRCRGRWRLDAGGGRGLRGRGSRAGLGRRDRWGWGRRRATGARADNVGGGEGRVERAELDVGVGDGCAGILGLDGGGNTGVGTARATSRSKSRAIDGVGGVEPECVGSSVIPQAHDENHTGGEGLAHTGETTLSCELIGVVKDSLLLSAESIGDGVGGVNARDLRDGVGVGLAVLDVEAADLVESAGVSAVDSDELSDDGELGGSVDGLASSVERLVTHAVRVEITSVLVADTIVPLVAITALGIAGASCCAADGARVGSEGGGLRVGLPDVHLRAAAAHGTGTRVGVAGGGGPSGAVGHPVDELEILRALSIAVTGTVFGTSLVGGVLRHATVLGHLREVQSTIETAGKVGDVHIKGELAVQKLEHLVVAVILHEVDAGTDVGAGA